MIQARLEITAQPQPVLLSDKSEQDAKDRQQASGSADLADDKVPVL